MLKSNSKAVREAVRRYILGNLGYNDDENREFTPEEARQGYLEWLKICRRYDSLEAFADWCRILPSEINFTYWTAAQRRRVAYWLKETEEEASRFTDDQAEHMFYHLIYRDIQKLWRAKK